MARLRLPPPLERRTTCSVPQWFCERRCDRGFEFEVFRHDAVENKHTSQSQNGDLRVVLVPEPHALVGPIVGLQGQSVDVVEELEVHLVQPLHAEKARVPLVLPR